MDPGDFIQQPGQHIQHDGATLAVAGAAAIVQQDDFTGPQAARQQRSH
jgi:hypothetical protein